MGIVSVYKTTIVIMSRKFSEATISEGINLIDGSTITNDGLILTLPSTGKGIILSNDNTSTLTNKTIIDNSNNVLANGIRTNTWSVDIGGSSPLDSQMLSYDSSNNSTIWTTNNGYSLKGQEFITKDIVTIDLYTYDLSVVNEIVYISALIIMKDMTKPGNSATHTIKGSFININNSVSRVKHNNTNNTKNNAHTKHKPQLIVKSPFDSPNISPRLSSDEDLLNNNTNNTTSTHHSKKYRSGLSDDDNSLSMKYRPELRIKSPFNSPSISPLPSDSDLLSNTIYNDTLSVSFSISNTNINIQATSNTKDELTWIAFVNVTSF